MKKTLVCLMLSTSISSFAEDYTCMQHFYNYGLATYAQTSCKFKYWNDEVTNYASKCYALAESLGETQNLENALKAGLSDFQRQYGEAEDKQEICQAFQDDFSNFVK